MPEFLSHPPPPSLPSPSRVIVVLGAAVRPDGSASPALRRRIVRAVAMARDWPEAPLILSGGRGRRHPTRAPSEALVMAALARAAGLTPDRLILEDQSSNTLQNAGHALGLAARLGADQVVVVTDIPHLPRALLSFQAVARARGLSLRIEGASAPGPRGRSRYLVTMAREAAARLVYRWRLMRGAALAAPGNAGQDRGLDA